MLHSYSGYANCKPSVVLGGQSGPRLETKVCITSAKMSFMESPITQKESKSDPSSGLSSGTACDLPASV